MLRYFRVIALLICF